MHSFFKQFFPHQVVGYCYLGICFSSSCVLIQLHKHQETQNCHIFERTYFSTLHSGSPHINISKIKVSKETSIDIFEFYKPLQLHVNKYFIIFYNYHNCSHFQISTIFNEINYFQLNFNTKFQNSIILSVLGQSFSFFGFEQSKHQSFF